MANPSPTYDNILWAGGDGIRVPTERSGFLPKPTQTGPSLDTYGEFDLGTTGASATVTLNAQQAGASLIVVTPTTALTLVFPTCQPGKKTLIQNIAGTGSITVEVNGNVTNTAVVTTGTIAMVVQTGYNGGVALVTGT